MFPSPMGEPSEDVLQRVKHVAARFQSPSLGRRLEQVKGGGKMDWPIF